MGRRYQAGRANEGVNPTGRLVGGRPPWCALHRERSEKHKERTNAALAFLILDGSIEFGDKPCQVCCGPHTGFAQTLQNAYPFGTRCRTGIWESGA